MEGHDLNLQRRCRPKQADVRNSLAQLDLDEGKQKGAIKHVTIGYARAWCDGPPYCYKPALDEAERLLKELGAPIPKLEPSPAD
jgi:hypothetical protein